jgi:hypothetical protein
MKANESGFVNVKFNTRPINLYKNKEDIKTKLNVKIMELSGQGFYYIHHNKFFDVEGRFDVQFDQGVWNRNLLKASTKH